MPGPIGSNFVQFFEKDGTCQRARIIFLDYNVAIIGGITVASPLRDNERVIILGRPLK